MLHIITKLLRRKRLYAYENSEGDKGIIIAYTENEARMLFKGKYPKRKIVGEETDDYWDDGAYLYEVSQISHKGKLYCTFEW